MNPHIVEETACMACDRKYLEEIAELKARYTELKQASEYVLGCHKCENDTALPAALTMLEELLHE